MRKISAVGLFCCDKFEETPKQKVIDLSKLEKFYFSIFTKNLVNVAMRMEEAFYNISMYLYNKNVLEYAQIARSGPKSMLRNIEDRSRIFISPHQKSCQCCHENGGGILQHFYVLV